MLTVVNDLSWRCQLCKTYNNLFCEVS